MRLTSIAALCIVATQVLGEDLTVYDLLKPSNVERLNGVTTTLYTDPQARHTWMGLNRWEDRGGNHFDHSRYIKATPIENVESLGVVNEVDGFGGSYHEDIAPEGYTQPLPVKRVIKASLELEAGGNIQFFLAQKSYRDAIREMDLPFSGELPPKLDGDYVLDIRGYTSVVQRIKNKLKNWQPYGMRFNNTWHDDIAPYQGERLPELGGGRKIFYNKNHDMMDLLESLDDSERGIQGLIHLPTSDRPLFAEPIMVGPTYSYGAHAYLHYSIHLNGDVVTETCYHGSPTLERPRICGFFEDAGTSGVPVKQEKIDHYRFFNSGNLVHKPTTYKPGTYDLQIDLVAGEHVGDFDLYAYGDFGDGKETFKYLTDDLYTEKVEVKNTTDDISYITPVMGLKKISHSKLVFDEAAGVSTKKYDAIPPFYMNIGYGIGKLADWVKPKQWKDDFYWGFVFIPEVAGDYYFEPNITNKYGYYSLFRYKTASKDRLTNVRGPSPDYDLPIPAKRILEDYPVGGTMKVEKIRVTPADVGKPVKVYTLLWSWSEMRRYYHLRNINDYGNVNMKWMPSERYNHTDYAEPELIWRVKTPNNTGFLTFSNFNRER